jgi:hypothetical protein
VVRLLHKMFVYRIAFWVHDDSTCRHRAGSLLRNFHLFRLEAAYEVREDIEVSAECGGGALCVWACLFLFGAR